jgi:nucleoside-diphosphate-sugar epimerase
MKVFVAGATGVLGRSAVQRFVEAGHDVTGVARSDEKANWLRENGARPVAVDVFDEPAVAEAVRGNDVVCNFATHIPSMTRLFLRSSWRTNDRLHAEASRILVDAALQAGASRYLQHSSGFMYADGGESWLDEDAPRDIPPHGESIEEAERQTLRFSEGGGAGVALRFGFFYGPSAGTTHDQIRTARMRLAPFPGDPDGFYPLIHTDDLGTASVAALHAPAAAYNVADDEPMTRRELADVVAVALGLKRLRIARIPVKRLDYIARSQRVSNKRFKEATGWSPSFPSGREGWPSVIAAMRGTA